MPPRLKPRCPACGVYVFQPGGRERPPPGLFLPCHGCLEIYLTGPDSMPETPPAGAYETLRKTAPLEYDVIEKHRAMLRMIRERGHSPHRLPPRHRRPRP